MLSTPLALAIKRKARAAEGEKPATVCKPRIVRVPKGMKLEKLGGAEVPLRKTMFQKSEHRAAELGRVSYRCTCCLVRS